MFLDFSDLKIQNLMHCLYLHFFGCSFLAYFLILPWIICTTRKKFLHTHVRLSFFTACLPKAIFNITNILLAFYHSSCKIIDINPLLQILCTHFPQQYNMNTYSFLYYSAMNNSSSLHLKKVKVGTCLDMFGWIQMFAWLIILVTHCISIQELDSHTSEI